MKYKKLLITGFAGFIGSHFTRKCLELGYQVVGVDSMTYASDIKHIVEFSENKNFTLILGNINDLPENFGCDVIINIAAESAVGKSIEDCTDFLHSNINGVHQLLEISKDKNIPLLQISTDEVLGDIVSGSFKEDANYNPSNPYSATKASAEMLIRAYARTYGVKYQIIRLTNNYGLDQDKEKLIPKTIEFFKQGKKIPLHNNGTPLRNWLHVSDSVEAILTILDKGNLNEIYHVNGNCELPNLTVVSYILHKMSPDQFINLESLLDLSVSRSGQDVRYMLDDSKLRSLGWEPKADFYNELDKIILHS